MHVHGTSKKTLKINPNLACEKQTSNNTWRQRLKNMKRDKADTYGINKITKQKRECLD